MEDLGTEHTVPVGCSMFPWHRKFEGILQKEEKEDCLLKQAAAGFGYLKRKILF